MLRFKFHDVRGLGAADQSFADSIFNAVEDPGSGTKPTSSSGSAFFPQPATGGFMMPGTMMPGGGMMPGTMMPGMMPGMPGMTPGLLPGMPGYIAPTPWYSGATGLLLLAGAALVAYKVFFTD